MTKEDLRTIAAVVSALINLISIGLLISHLK